jgi:hypothetical protein
MGMAEIRIADTDTAEYMIRRTALSEEQYPAAQTIFYNCRNVVTCALDLAHPNYAPHQEDLTESLDALKAVIDLPEDTPVEIQQVPAKPLDPVSEFEIRDTLLEQLRQAAQTAKDNSFDIISLAGIFDAAKAEVGLSPADTDSAQPLIQQMHAQLIINPFGFKGTLGIAFQTCDDLKTYINRHSTKIIQGMIEDLLRSADDTPDLPDSDSR